MQSRNLVLASLSLAIAIPVQAQSPTVDGCAVYPSDHIWNAAVDTLPVHAQSNAFVSSIGNGVGVHPDFGSGLFQQAPIGIPFVTVPASQPLVTITYRPGGFGDESDPGPFPIPPNAPIEGGNIGSGGDRHVLVIDRGNCVLYELYRAFKQGDGSWRADSGARYDLADYALRPDGFTSADAAGLPIFPGLARFEEVAAGEIRHALRFTAPQTRDEHVWPARHDAGDPGASLPPMGQRFRLKANVDITGFSSQVQVILRGLKKYGMILADNGSAWYISGAPDPGWDNDQLVGELSQIHGSDFEAVDSSSLMGSPDSGQVNGNPPQPTITLTRPNGGETFRINRKGKIRWNSSGLGAGNVMIELSRNGGNTFSTILASTPNDGLQKWRATGPATTQARIRITSLAQGTVTDTSNANFVIR
jgi:hypothetical protein